MAVARSSLAGPSNRSSLGYTVPICRLGEIGSIRKKIDDRFRRCQVDSDAVDSMRAVRIP